MNEYDWVYKKAVVFGGFNISEFAMAFPRKYLTPRARVKRIIKKLNERELYDDMLVLTDNRVEMRQSDVGFFSAKLDEGVAV